MPLFDADSYFANRLNGSTADQKLIDLVVASKQKESDLASRSASLDQQIAQQKAQQAIADAATAKSWVGKLGLDPGSFVANRVNDAASMVSGASRVAGQLASLPANLDSLGIETQANQAEFDAYNRVQGNKALPGDVEQLQRQTVGNGPTLMQEFQRSAASRATGRAINDTFNLEGIVQQKNRLSLTTDLGTGFQENWDKVKTGQAGQVASGLAGLLLHAGDAVIHNPSAVREYALENLPQLFMGAFGKAGQAAMAASNVGYAVDNYQQGIENYAKANGGQMPPEAQRQRMAILSGSLAVAENVGDFAGLSWMKSSAKAAADPARAGFIQSLKNVGKAAGEGVLSEAPTEGYQTWAEGEITGKPASALDIYTGAVIGGASGATLSGGGRAAHEITKPVDPNAVAPVQQVDPATAKVVDSAINTGDVSVLIDPTKTAYAPDKAIRALFGHSQQATTTDEAKQANLAKADQIIADLESERDANKSYLKTPADIQADIDGLKTQMAAVDPTDTTKLAKFQALIAISEQDLAEPPLSGAERVGIQAKVTSLDRMVRESNLARDNLSDLVNSKASVEAMVSQADQAIDPAKPDQHTAAIDRVITMAMASPASLDHKRATQLADNAGNALTAPQRTFLRTFSEARVAENQLMDMGGVSADIYTGKKNKGIAQYQAAFGRALSTGNQQAADHELAGLQKFEQDHTGKATVAAQALNTGLGTQIVSDGKGGWSIPASPLAKKALTENGGLAINTGRLVQNITTEAGALTKAVAEMNSAYSIKFTTGESHVTDLPPKAPGPKPGLEAAQQPAGQAARPSGDAVNAGDVSTKTGPGTAAVRSEGGVVGDAGVTQSTQSTTVNSRDSVSTVNTEKSQTSEKTQVSQKTETSTVKGEGSVEFKSTAENTAQVEPKPTELAAVPKETTEVVAKVTEPVVKSAQPTGALAAMATKSPEGTSYKARNLLADYFRQSAVNEADKTQRPLVVAKDFLTQLSVNKALEFLSLDKLEAKQLELLKVFKSTAKEWFPTIQANLKKAENPDYYFKDLMQFMLQGEGKALDLEENVKTAMVYGAVNWIVASAARSQFNGPEDINTLLDRDETHQVSEYEYEKLGHVGARQNAVFTSLGQPAVQALGLKATKDAKGNLMAQLESQMGAHILKLLLDHEIIVRETVPGEVMAYLTGKETTDKNADHHFVKLNYDAEGALHPKAQELLEAIRGTQGVLDKLFSVESSMREPSHEPIPYKQTKTKNTGQDVPSVAKPILEKENAVASYVHPGMWQFASVVDADTLLEIAGAEDLDGKHAANIPGMKATNDALLREITNFKEFVGDMMTEGKPDLTKPLYFDHTMWLPQRVGIATNLINPQTSKVHRNMMYREAWETEIDTASNEQMEGFLLRVGEGLGVKTDKQDNAKSLVQTLEKMDGVNAGVAALVRMLQSPDSGTMSAADQKAVLAAVKQGGEKMHSLASLMALAQYKIADVAGESKFKVQLMGEVDGVTNGPMLSHLLLGAASTPEQLFSLLNRGGFFEQGNQHENYNLWRAAAGHFDLYETTAGHMTQSVQRFINEGMRNKYGKVVMSAGKDGTVALVMNAIYGFTKELADKDGAVLKEGRNIIKTPLTAMVFGSSVGKAVQSMADKFISSIYAGIEDTKAGKDKSLSREQIIKNLNVLLSQGKAPSVPTSTTLDQLMSTPFTLDQVKGLQTTFTNTLGKAVRQTMEADFVDFITQRKAFNTTAQITHEVYNAAYTAMHEQLLNEQMDLFAKDEKTGIPFTTIKGERQALHDLSANEIAEIDKRLADLKPLMHTPMSKDSGQLSAGLYIGKKERKLSTSSTYKGEVKFGTGIKGTQVWSKTKGAFVEQTGMGTTGFETVAASPGVSMSPVSTHSTDSATMHYALGGSQALNIHDAMGVGIGGFTEAAQSLNKSLWKVMLGYSPATEVYEAMSRTVRGYAALASTGALPPGAIANLVSSLKAMAKKDQHGPDFGPDMVTELLNNAKRMAFKADSIKLEAMGQMASVDQYALQGGNYTVTETDREAALAQRAELTEAVDEKTSTAVKEIEAILAAELKDKTIEKVTEHIPDSEEDQTPARVANNPFTELGTPMMQSDSQLVSWFQNNPKPTANSVIALLVQRFNQDTTLPNQAFNLQLLKMLGKSVDPFMPVNYVTGQYKGQFPQTEGPARALFTMRGDKEQIFVLSPEFVHSGLTDETLLHELTHAAVTAKRYSNDPAVKPYVDEMYSLLEKAQAFVKANKLVEWKYAVSNLDELIAFGMTSDLFQQRVLAQITMESKVTGFKAFIQSLTKILFGGWAQKPAINTGMEVMIGNVTHLMAMATQAKAKTDGTVTLAMASPQAQQDDINNINSYSTLDILHALDNGTLQTSFQLQLGELLSGMVEKLHGPFGSFKAAMRKTEAGNPMAVWLKALETGKAPFASAILASGFTGNNQQDFAMQQVEATVRAAMNANETATRVAYRELYDLYNETQARLKPADFLGGTFGTHTMVEAQALYNFVFDAQKSSDGRSDYLSRFVALGLAHQGFNGLLKVATERQVKVAPKGIVERLNAIFHNILEFFQHKLAGTYQGQNADEKLSALVNHLVDIEAGKRHALAREASGWNNFMAPIEEKAAELVRVGHRRITAVMGSDIVREHKNAFVRGAFSLSRSITRSRIDGFLQSMIRFRDLQTKGEQGLLAGLITNVKNPIEGFKLLLMAAKLGDRKRDAEAKHNDKFVLESFINNGRGMGKPAKAAITSVFLRTGLHALVDHMTMSEIEGLMGNPTAIDAAITTFEGKLTEFGALKDAFSLDANYLAYHKVTGLNPSKVLRLNATQIAKRFGGQNNLTDAQVTRAVASITPLVALYALRYLSAKPSTEAKPSALALAKAVMQTENNRPADQGNGVEFTLQLARHLEGEAQERLFDGDASLMVHGYTPEIYNYRTVLVTANEVDGKELEHLGYVKGALAQKDPADTDRDVKHLYRLADGGLPPHVTGAIAYGTNKAKGSQAHGSYMNLNTVNGLANQMSLASIQAHRAQALAQTPVGNPRRDLSKETGNFMAPLFTGDGTVANWRYLMADSTKDTLLERTNDFDKLIGSLAGTIQSKPNQLSQNKLAIQGMRDQYESEYATRGDSYEEIGPKSADPAMRSIWDLLPEQTKEDAREIWGSDKLKVRSDSLDLLFGYSKLQASDPLKRAYEERRNNGLDHSWRSLGDLHSINIAQKMVIGVAEILLYNHARGVKRLSHADAEDYTKRLGHWVAQGQNIWQEIVRETKDILVVKTGATMVGNILSNFSMLWLQGVPVNKMVTDTLVALRGATSHKADSDELALLRTQLATGYTQGRDVAMERRIRILEDSLARNPTTKLIDEGLMPTIVEDLAADEDVYSYKSALSRKVAGVTSQINPTVVKAARTVYMAHDTPLYRGLSHVTQMSDFLARYVLYQHQTTREKKPLSHKEAVLRASDAFVNYDIPMHRMMQYSDDMGFTVFTKYFLYIQRELWRVGREQPARLYSMIALSHMMSLGPIVLDSGLMKHSGNNPFRSGAFDFLGSLKQLLTVKSALAVVK